MKTTHPSNRCAPEANTEEIIFKKLMSCQFCEWLLLNSDFPTDMTLQLMSEVLSIQSFLKQSSIVIGAIFSSFIVLKMLYPLLLLLKKDLLLSLRNRIWTAVEVLLPASFLLLTAFLAYKAKTGILGSQSDSGKFEIIHNYGGSPSLTVCPGKEAQVLITGEQGSLKYLSFTKVSSKTEMLKQITEKIKICKENEKETKTDSTKEFPKMGIIMGDDESDSTVSYTIYVPANGGDYNTDEWEELAVKPKKENLYVFSNLQYQVDHTLLKNKFKHVQGHGSITPLEAIVELRPHIAHMRFIPLVLSFCLFLMIVNITRTVVTEKSTVKPYLSAMGLPVWMFYCEHLIASYIKTLIIVPLSLSLWVYVLEEIDTFIFLFGSIIFAFGTNSFALLFAAFFKTSKRATEVTVVFWLIFAIIPYVFTAFGFRTILYSLNIVHAFTLYFDGLVTHVYRDEKPTFLTLFSSENVRYYPCGVYLIMMIFDAVWMFGAAILIDHYKSKIDSFGYINLFNKIRRRSAGRESVTSPEEIYETNDGLTSCSVSSENRLLGGSSENSPLLQRDVILVDCAQVEKHRNQATADIDLKNLVKIYPTGEKAVKGLTLRAIRGQVSILLGHNGCGKSTTFSMISGIHLPTSGSILIGGTDAIANRHEARSFIGLCPQYNPIYEKLTVMEHLALVNALKGGSRKEGKREALELLTDIDLIAKKNTLAGNLSGGMKRKLCVCMAMINNSKVILLDEPTAGMDPGARKDVQKMLEKVKKDRTILLTTHYMDEAERLGDWIFVMSHGKMAASGTSAFLKKKLGSGFLLTIVIENEGDKREIYKLIESVCKSYVPNASLKDTRGQMMEFNIPEASKKNLKGLLEALEAIKEKRYNSNVLSSIQEETKNRLSIIKISTLGLALGSLEQVFIKIGEKCKQIENGESKDKEKSGKAISYQKLMEMKKQPQRTGVALYASQFGALIKKRFRYSVRNYEQYMVQVLIPFILLFLFCFYTRKPDHDWNRMELSLSAFPASLVYMKGNHKGIEDYLKGFDHLTFEKTDETNMLKLVQKHYRLEPRLGFVVDYNGKNLKILYNAEAVKAKPLLTNALTNLLLIVDGKSQKKINSFAEFQHTDDDVLQTGLMTAYFLAIVITFLLSLITSPFVVFLIEERVSKYSHQQLLTGVSQAIFWGASVVYDLAFFFILSALIIIMLALFGWVEAGQFFSMTAVFMLYFYAMIPLIYTSGAIVNGPSKASILLIVYQFIFALFCTMILALIMFLKRDLVDTTKMIFYSFVPTTGFLHGIVKVENEKDSASWFKFDELSDWNGITSEVVFLFFSGTCFLIVFLLLQVRKIREIIFVIFHSKQKARPRAQYKMKPCQAVFNEETDARKPNIEKSVVVLIKDLVRQFGTYRAVNGICLTVKNNECFGMLGTNGAGKTTTFDILTGLRFPSGGAAYVDGHNVSKRTTIGYCPQFDAILQEYTGREVLELIAQLQGYRDVDLITNHVLNCVGMTEHAHKRVRFCSGGQKRKISVGIALLSRSHCVILDEPTAGIDPDARRDIWETLVWLREKSGCSIVLTSHSMEECEALCSRIAILKKGEVIALGTSQDLKSQYGNSYSLTLVMSKIGDRNNFCEEVKRRIEGSILKTAESNKTLSLNWEIPKKANDKWSKKFSEAQTLAKDLKAADFMLAESSLEDTFILLTSD